MKRKSTTLSGIDMGIQERRNQALRIKNKFYAKQKHVKLWSTDEKAAGIYANHGKSCSCWRCCNPRRNGELTMQEKKADKVLI